MRALIGILVAFLTLMESNDVVAQRMSFPHHQAHLVSLSISLDTGRPSLSVGGFVLQAGAGSLGGLAGLAAAGLPIYLAWSGAAEDDTLVLLALGSGYLAGMTMGVHYAGRAQGMRANPLATIGGGIVGLTVSGAMMAPFITDDGEATGPAPLFVFVVPSFGATTGYVLTRRHW